MAAWMAYAVVVSALLMAAAWAAERAVRMYRGPTRLLWGAAMLGSAGIPAAAWAAPALLPSAGPAGEVAGAPAAAAAVVLERLHVTATPAGVDLDLVLACAWALASAVLLGRLLSARLRLAAELAPAARRRLGDVRVVLTPELGPAVTGLRRRRVVLPRWLWRLGPRERRLAVAHEREHLRAGDPWLLAGARLLATLAPWNLPLWWGLRRLKLAAETDCDRRVLRGGADPRAYGDLLLRVGERSRPVRGLAALAERTSFLERRIDEMTRETTKRRGVKAVLAAAVAVAALAVACESPTPIDEGPDAAQEAAPPAAGDEAADEAGSVEELPPPPQGGKASDRPAFIPYDVRPELSNAGEVRETLEATYPQTLQEQGVGGRTVVWIFVNHQGAVEKVRIHESSGIEALDRAAKSVARSMEFAPARQKGEPTGVWVQQPIIFQKE